MENTTTIIFGKIFLDSHIFCQSFYFYFRNCWIKSNRSFSETLNVRDGLDLLKRFSWMQSIERLQGDLNSKVAVIFAWPRQLLERIESPMIICRENTELLRTKEAKRIVRKCKTETKSMLMVVGCWLLVVGCHVV